VRPPPGFDATAWSVPGSLVGWSSKQLQPHRIVKTRRRLLTTAAPHHTHGRTEGISWQITSSRHGATTPPLATRSKRRNVGKCSGKNRREKPMHKRYTPPVVRTARRRRSPSAASGPGRVKEANPRGSRSHPAGPRNNEVRTAGPLPTDRRDRSLGNYPEANPHGYTMQRSMVPKSMLVRSADVIDQAVDAAATDGVIPESLWQRLWERSKTSNALAPPTAQRTEHTCDAIMTKIRPGHVRAGHPSVSSASPVSVPGGRGRELP